MREKHNTTHAPLRVNKIVLHRFAKDRLPPAVSFYEAELGKLTRPNRKGWAMGRCPFHASKSGKSFSVNVGTGGFRCWGCDVRGGDIIDFIRLRDGLTFPEACRQLGAWDEVGQPAPATVAVRHLTFDFASEGNRYSVSVTDEPKNYASMIGRFYRESGERLTGLGLDQAESGEAETYWTRLALATAELRGLGI